MMHDEDLSGGEPKAFDAIGSDACIMCRKLVAKIALTKLPSGAKVRICPECASNHHLIPHAEKRAREAATRAAALGEPVAK